MMQLALQRSPLYQPAQDAGAEFGQLAGWAVVQRYPAEDLEVDLFAAGRGVAIADESANGKIMVEGDRAGEFLSRVWQVPDLTTGHSVSAGRRAVYRLRGDQYLLHIEPGAAQGVEGQLTARLQDNDGVVVVSDMTHGRAEFLLLGPDSAVLLSRLCGLNFDGQQFPSGMAQQSSVAKTRQLVIREDRGLYPVFRLIGARSLAVYLWNTILEAGQDLGITPIGRVTLDALD